jgi:transcriptional regulator with XRE-family HTH domain
MTEVGQKLRMIRGLYRLSQESLSRDLKMSQPGYAKLERGETDIPFSRLKQIAEYYKLSVVDLLTFGEDRQAAYGNRLELELYRKEVEYLKQRLDDKDEIINLLKRKLEDRPDKAR